MQPRAPSLRRAGRFAALFATADVVNVRGVKVDPGHVGSERVRSWGDFRPC